MVGLPIGSFINAGAIIIGGISGTLLGEKIPERIQKSVLYGLGLCVFAFGIKLSLGGNFILSISCMVLGGIIGELLKLDTHLTSFALYIKTRLRFSDALFIDGFVSATMIFCIGSMTILGPIEESLEGKRNMLYIKSLLDLFTSSMFATRYGIGVVFSFVPLLIYQSLMFYLASLIKPIIPDHVLVQLLSVGGIMTMGVALGILEIKKMSMVNYLPALFLAVVVANIF